MRITANTPAYGSKQRVSTPRLAIIEVILDQLPHIGTAGHLLYLSLIQNYAPDPSRLCYEPIFFDINNTGAVLESHTAKMAALVGKLQDG